MEIHNSRKKVYYNSSTTYILWLGELQDNGGHDRGKGLGDESRDKQHQVSESSLLVLKGAGLNTRGYSRREKELFSMPFSDQHQR